MIFSPPSPSITLNTDPLLSPATQTLLSTVLLSDPSNPKLRAAQVHLPDLHLCPSTGCITSTPLGSCTHSPCSFFHPSGEALKYPPSPVGSPIVCVCHNKHVSQGCLPLEQLFPCTVSEDSWPPTMIICPNSAQTSVGWETDKEERWEWQLLASTDHWS